MDCSLSYSLLLSASLVDCLSSAAIAFTLCQRPMDRSSSYSLLLSASLVDCLSSATIAFTLCQWPMDRSSSYSLLLSSSSSLLFISPKGGPAF
jgi:hypothetical protein